MDLLQLRENEIFETLKRIKDSEFVIIGGYGVNAYTLPRFSVDCDIVIRDTEELRKIEELLVKSDYTKEATDKLSTPYHGEFERYEKNLEKEFKVNMDILIKDVLDRQTNATFSAEWIFQNSGFMTLKGKTIQEELQLRIINVDALFVMKMLCCRPSDIRDLFMLVTHIEDKEWIKQEVSNRYDFNNRLSKVKKKVTSKQFKDGLQGVFGFLEDRLFERNKKLILELE